MAGLILAMAGGTLEHARRTATVIGLLGAQLRGQICSALDGNARVRVPESGNARLVCPSRALTGGSLRFHPRRVQFVVVGVGARAGDVGLCHLEQVLQARRA